MPLFVDQTGQSLIVPDFPKRILSLVPSQTELLSDLGLDDRVIGITRFCVHPQGWKKRKQMVGGTKNLEMALIRKLQPDLILANKEENQKDQVEELGGDFPVWVSDIQNTNDACRMMEAVGKMTNSFAKAESLVRRIREAFASIPRPQQRPRVAYLIWNNPFMVAGGDSFIHHMLEQAGFENVFGHLSRYPVVQTEDLRNAGCDWILLSNEPFPFKEKHRAQFRLSVPGSPSLLVDGAIFSWYGSRMLQAPSYFKSLWEQIHASH